MAAHASWAKTSDPAARTAPAREAMRTRFLDEVDPDRVLPEAERVRRAGHARQAYMAGLALKAAKARRLRSEADQLDTEAAEAEGAA
ncbi:MAG: hypothetical protein WD250_13145 [Egibacteraceae bacterium]